MQTDCYRLGEQGNCYILRDSEEALIVECGVPFDEAKKSYELLADLGDSVWHPLLHEPGTIARAFLMP